MKSTVILASLGLLGAAQQIRIQLGNGRDLEEWLAELEAEAEAETVHEEGDVMPKAFEPEAFWTPECEVSSEFTAEIYAVPNPFNPPEGIAWAFDFLDEFWTSDDGGELPYPGDFDEFIHPDGFRVIKVNYDELPAAVRKWREEKIKDKSGDERKWIAVKDDVAFFAPNIVNLLLPYFATASAVSGRDACVDDLAHLSADWNHNRVSDDASYKYWIAGKAEIGNSLHLQMFAQKSTESPMGDL